MRTLRLTPLLLICAFATGAAAQYPDKPIRLIVPQAAGSATDTVARIRGAELGKELAQQIVIDNRPGGALTIGLDLTAKAEPDGYTICMVKRKALTRNPRRMGIASIFGAISLLHSVGFCCAISRTFSMVGVE